MIRQFWLNTPNLKPFSNYFIQSGFYKPHFSYFKTHFWNKIAQPSCYISHQKGVPFRYFNQYFPNKTLRLGLQNHNSNHHISIYTILYQFQLKNPYPGLLTRHENSRKCIWITTQRISVRVQVTITVTEILNLDG